MIKFNRSMLVRCWFNVGSMLVKRWFNVGPSGVDENSNDDVKNDNQDDQDDNHAAWYCTVFMIMTNGNGFA